MASSKGYPIPYVRRILHRVTFILLELWINACKLARVGHLKSFKRMYTRFWALSAPLNWGIECEPGSGVCIES
jgi:hypothetical protein